MENTNSTSSEGDDATDLYEFNGIR